MIDRKEVEALLGLLESVHKPNPGVMSQLCRSWLAMQDARETEADNEGWIATCGFKPGQRARLLPAGPDGGCDG